MGKNGRYSVIIHDKDGKAKVGKDYLEIQIGNL
jgi:hypothetical protein